LVEATMCGIAGIVSFDARPVALDDLRAMCAAMVHRGPDEDGFYVDPHVGLGMRRLSIIDLETGRQPIASEDGTVWAIFNGEIYNYRELRSYLETRGHTFRTATDTETIVHLYEEEGERCVDKLRGMFAFAVWDKRARRLLLARDRLGIKPLYYTWAGQRLFFASELKALLELPEVERTVSPSSLDHLLTFLYTPPSESIVAGVRKLEPGHTLIASPEREIRVERYWNVKFVPERGRSVEYFEERLRALLEESVRLHMVSDVPLGAFLSGGIDSSSVVATMARLSPRPVKTFSVGFPDRDFNELGYARQVASALGTDHRELVVEPAALQIVEDLAWHLDEPFGDSSAIPTYLVSQLAAEEVTVVLSGDGGDELFGGYDKYVVEGRERRLRFLPPWGRRLFGAISARIPEGARGKRFLRHHSLAAAERYLDACTLFTLEEKRKLLQPDLFLALGGEKPWHGEAARIADPNRHWLSSLQCLDLENYLPLDILTKVDRMSMAHSLEARVPLLDHKLVEFAATIPPGLLLHRGTTKYLFKRAMRGILPDAVLERPKQGFAIPLGRWFRGKLADFARDLLLSETSRRRGIFNPRYVARLIERQDPEENLGLQLWTLLSFELWCKTFLDRRRSVRRAEPAARVEDGQARWAS